MRRFSEERQRTVWLTSPHIGAEPRDSGAGDSGREASDPERIDRLNELIREVAASHRDWVRVVDLAEYMGRRRGGEFDPELRADRVHFTNEGARRIADEWLGRAIVKAYVRGIR